MVYILTKRYLEINNVVIDLSVNCVCPFMSMRLISLKCLMFTPVREHTNPQTSSFI